ncbi:MAG: proprotein convertase P-domain-containing protein, partial [Robiginitalea sp.]
TLSAEDLPNTGSAEVQLPRVPTPFGRFMVRASDHIYFAVNESDFTLNEQPFLLYFNDLEVQACQPGDAVFEFTYQTFGGFDAPVALEVSGVPSSLNALFSADTVQVDGSPVSLTLSGTETVPPGSYPLQVIGTDGSASVSIPITLRIADDDFTEPVLLFPEDAALDVNLNPELQWTGNPEDLAYDLELATDPLFTSPILQRRIYDTHYKPGILLEDTVYYWRVRPVNVCGEGVFGAFSSFTTINSDCRTLTATGLPIPITSAGPSTITSRIAVADNQPVLGVKVTLDLAHSFVSDLIISLTSPKGTKVTLVSNNCGAANDISATFDSNAPPFVCSNNPAISGLVRPLGSLDAFVGESSFGEWVLTVEDVVAADGGSLNAFSLELCVEGEFRPDEDQDGVFDDGDDLCLGTPPGAEVDANGCQVFRFPENRFLITAYSESCLGLQDGRIVVAATEPFDYSLQVQGNTTDFTDSFTSTYEIEGLPFGSYTVCLGGANGTVQYESQCFQITVGSPEPLGVLATQSLDYDFVDLLLDGSEYYVVTLNGQTQTINDQRYTLELNKGYNRLKVEGFPACKGTFEADFFRTDQPVVAPNPFTDHFDIRMLNSTEEAEVKIFSLSGVLVWRGERMPESGSIHIEVPGLPSGLYIVEIKQKGISTLHKIKRE